MTVRHDLRAWAGLGLALVGVLWLAPLMMDQVTFFGDRDQEADAEAARSLMPTPALLLAAGATLLGVLRGPVLGAAVALPLGAVALAWLAPEALYQLLAYGFTAPIAVGAGLAACIPLNDAGRRPLVIVAIAVIATGFIVATPFLALLASLGLATWWRLSGSSRRPGTASAPSSG